MSVSLAFVAVLAGIVILVTLILTWCALRMSHNTDREPDQPPERALIIPKHLLASDRRQQKRDDFPIACNDGTYAWYDRRRSAYK